MSDPTISPARRAGLLRDPLPWSLAVLAALVFGLAPAEPLFAALFPGLERPLYRQDGFAALLAAHVAIVAVSSAAAVVVGCSLGTLVTRRWGRDFRTVVDSVVAMGQTFPPVAVLALAAPFLGFGAGPALIALFLYGLLPIVEATIAGLGAVPAATLEAARGMGLTRGQIFRRIELPLAAPVVLAGIRTSVIINIGTAAIASTVGAKTLGTPIIVGLNGFNSAYVLQGALVVGALAVAADLAFQRLTDWSERWRRA